MANESAPATPAKASNLRKGLNAVDAEKRYVRPHRNAVQHVRNGKKCPVTILRADQADFHARQPGVINTITCSTCRVVSPASEFVWNGTDEVVGSA